MDLKHKASIKFEVEAICKDTGARAGVLTTPHGVVKTPVFMPVGTNGTLKSLTLDQTLNCGAQIILGNSYHLYLRPGHELIKNFGGLHKFTTWNMPMLTDSGGFQVMSLSKLLKKTSDGVYFKDPKGGKTHFIGPARSMEIQNAIGADIIMAFDDFPPNPATYDQAKFSMERTHEFLEICVKNHKNSANQALFGIVQGSIYEDLRIESAKFVTNIDLPGYAIGGVAVGEDRETIEKISLFTANLLPYEKPRYLMGIGTPWDITHAIYAQIDMFDCVSPTRLARHGSFFLKQETPSIKRAQYSNDPLPLDPNCQCSTCLRYSRAYLHHIVRQKEMIGAILLSVHNVYTLINYANMARLAILAGRFKEFYETESSLRMNLKQL